MVREIGITITMPSKNFIISAQQMQTDDDRLDLAILYDNVALRRKPLVHTIKNDLDLEAFIIAEVMFDIRSKNV